MRFRTTVQLNGKTATGVEIPPDIVEGLGAGKKPPVNVTINGYTYRSSVAVMGGKFMVGISAEHRAGAKVAAGDTVDIDLELDTAPREVTVPDDLAAALAGDPAAKVAFEKLSYSHKRQHVLAIEAAKTPETRARRVAGALAVLHKAR
jgi:hypothetical protein